MNYVMVYKYKTWCAQLPPPPFYGETRSRFTLVKMMLLQAVKLLLL